MRSWSTCSRTPACWMTWTSCTKMRWPGVFYSTTRCDNQAVCNNATANIAQEEIVEEDKKKARIDRTRRNINILQKGKEEKKREGNIL